MKPITRRERRADRQRRYLMTRATPGTSFDSQSSGANGAPKAWDGETPLPWWLRHLDCKVSSESGAMRVHSRVRTWHLGNRKNGHAPPPGLGWDRSGPVYILGAAGPGRPRSSSTTGGGG